MIVSVVICRNGSAMLPLPPLVPPLPAMDARAVMIVRMQDKRECHNKDSKTTKAQKIQKKTQNTVSQGNRLKTAAQKRPPRTSPVKWRRSRSASTIHPRIEKKTDV